MGLFRKRDAKDKQECVRLGEEEAIGYFVMNLAAKLWKGFIWFAFVSDRLF